MAKLSIEVDGDQVHDVHVKVDGKPVGLIAGLRFEANNAGELELEATVPDTGAGLAYGELLKKLPFAKVNIYKVVA